MSDKKHTQWLRSQLPQWVKEKLISQNQALAIEKYHNENFSAQPSQNMARTIFSSIGAVLFSLGVILFFAYTWQDMHRFLKLALIFSAIISAHAGALYFSKRTNDLPNKNHSVSEGLTLLGTMLFGVGLWLVSQIYHINEHYPNFFMAWGIGALLMAWARLSLIQAMLALILLSIWGYLEIIQFYSINHFSPWLILIGFTPLAWILRSSLLLFFNLSVFYALWMASLRDPLDKTLYYVIVVVAVIFISSGIIASRAQIKNFTKLRYALIIPGYTVYLSYVFCLTFAHFIKTKEVLTAFENNFQAIFFWLPISIATVTSICACLPLKNCRVAEEKDQLHIILTAISLAVIYSIGTNIWPLPYLILSGIMNLIFIGHCLLFIIYGSRDQRGWEVALGCLLFSILIFARYSDLFESLLTRSMAFIILGISLFLIGNFYSRYQLTHLIPSKKPSKKKNRPFRERSL